MRNSVKTWLNSAAAKIELITIVWLRRIAAITLIIVGIITFPLPLPIGLILIIVGLAMLVSSSQSLANFVRQYRAKSSGINMNFEKSKRYLPAFIKRALEKTDP